MANTENNRKINEDKQSQTIQLSNKVRINLFNLEAYFQNFNSDMSAILVLDQIQLEDKKSHIYDKNMNEYSKTNLNPNGDIIVLFKKLPNDTESKNGIAKIIVRNLCIEACIETLNGLADLVDDDDYLNEIKDSIPISIMIENSKFYLSYYDNENKNIGIKINKIILKKL